ncbi:helix-turn-helix domain-containing protein [Microbulbifer variabilis]|uniref:helix-turn-helix domain-containing protein n=1 Tax=Microbulbifer variabilis TaxID=266805 RepID=UPI0039A64D75
MARTLDVSSRAIQNWINTYKVGGFKTLTSTLTSKRRGRPEGINHRLTPEQEKIFKNKSQTNSQIRSSLTTCCGHARQPWS